MNSTTSTFLHTPVFLKESIDNLSIKEDGVYVDCTYGRGGHSKKILSKLGDKGRLLSLDKDLEAEEHAKKAFINDKRFKFIRANFSKINEIVEKNTYTGGVDGILIDLGVSSPQLDNASRGFSFLKNGPLDMRMDQTQKLTAEDWISNSDYNELKSVIKNYGDEKYASKIARKIIEKNTTKKIRSTSELQILIEEIYPKGKSKKNPATKTFQAIRIHINDEINELKKILENSLNILRKEGRIVVITFHSLEDRIVKKFFKENSNPLRLLSNVPIPEDYDKPKLKELVTIKKVTEQEYEKNPRSRSAKLRVAERI